MKIKSWESTGIFDINGTEIFFGNYCKVIFEDGLEHIGRVTDWGPRIVVMDVNDTRIDIFPVNINKKLLILSENDFFKEMTKC